MKEYSHRAVISRLANRGAKEFSVVCVCAVLLRLKPARTHETYTQLDRREFLPCDRGRRECLSTTVKYDGRRYSSMMINGKFLNEIALVESGRSVGIGSES